MAKELGLNHHHYLLLSTSHRLSEWKHYDAIEIIPHDQGWVMHDPSSVFSSTAVEDSMAGQR
jgi:hypothetical protein